eukprot:scaffold253038_cov32-Tisochrysis_lutea.AAC.1
MRLESFLAQTPHRPSLSRRERRRARLQQPLLLSIESQTHSEITSAAVPLHYPAGPCTPQHTRAPRPSAHCRVAGGGARAVTSRCSNSPTAPGQTCGPASTAHAPRRLQLPARTFLHARRCCPPRRPCSSTTRPYTLGRRSITCGLETTCPIGPSSRILAGSHRKMARSP